MHVCSHCGVQKDDNNFQINQSTGNAIGWCRFCRTNLEKERRIARGYKPRILSKIIDGKKLCLHCGVFIGIVNFSPVNRGIGGISAYCRPCSRIRAKARREKDPSIAVKATAKYRANNREKYLAAHRITQFKRKTKLKIVNDGTLSENVLKSIYALKYCYYCRRYVKKLSRTLEHILPLNKGGQHSINNVTMACFTCNSSKRDMTELEFLEYRKKA